MKSFWLDVAVLLVLFVIGSVLAMIGADWLGGGDGPGEAIVAGLLVLAVSLPVMAVLGSALLTAGVPTGRKRRVFLSSMLGMALGSIATVGTTVLLGAPVVGVVFPALAAAWMKERALRR